MGLVQHFSFFKYKYLEYHREDRMQLSRIECIVYYEEKCCLMKLVSAACVSLYVCMTGLLCKLFLTMGCRQ